MGSVKLSDRAPLDFDQFNESFMMHGTTSTFYPLIASLDVAAAMMDEPAGPTLMNETLADEISFRQAMSSVAHRLRLESESDKEWLFGVYQPERVTDPCSLSVRRRVSGAVCSKIYLNSSAFTILTRRSRKLCQNWCSGFRHVTETFHSGIYPMRCMRQ
jgi:arginine/lysine/ornithine decarboxylase